MEATIALRTWQRSVEKLKLRYTRVISDGDSNTIKHHNDNNNYYGDVVILKYECVGHVQKRLGTQLRSLKKSGKTDSKVKAIKFGGKGQLSDKHVISIFPAVTIGTEYTVTEQAVSHFCIEIFSSLIDGEVVVELATEDLTATVGKALTCAVLHTLPT